jgi:anti-sigma regulatory factor (Ser/Thr protein kinase)
MRLLVNRLFSGAGGGNKIAYSLLTVLDELCCNMMEHSHASWIEIELRPDNEKVQVILRDDGVPFDPTEQARTTDYEAYLQTETNRQLGLYMVQELTELFHYQRLDDKVNEVTFVMKTEDLEKKGGQAEEK